MSSIREQIVAAAFTAISTSPPSGVPTPIRTRVDSPTEDQVPALTLYQHVEAVDSLHGSREGEPRPRRDRGPVVRRTVVIQLEALVKATETNVADTEVDALLVWGVKAIRGAGNFGGLANQAADEMGTEFKYEQYSISVCRATTTFEIEYQSLTDDPESAV